MPGDEPGFLFEQDLDIANVPKISYLDTLSFTISKIGGH